MAVRSEIKKVIHAKVSGSVGGEAGKNSVKYVPQELTEAEKKTARKNIGAAGIRDLRNELDRYEKRENKVTEINKSSTDEQYPSAAAVYEFLEAAAGGDILQTLIDTDMLCAVTDGDGAILTDENGNILLW